jgi:hypothetical protein
VNPDYLYNLLPAVYRQRDEEGTRALRALLAVITEQAEIVRQDIDQLYRNWFIETCEDWVVPYLGDLIGYRPVHDAGDPADPALPGGRALNRVLIPRREVAGTVGYRRRKGTLALLEELANQVAGYPARAVEFYRLLGWTQHLDHARIRRGRTADLRDAAALERLEGAFERTAHTVDVRRVVSSRTPGRFNIPGIGLFVWRLKACSVSRTSAEADEWKSADGWSQANCLEEQSANCYAFSVLGNSAPLFTRPQPEEQPTHIAAEQNVPFPIRRCALAADGHGASADLYGPGKSLAVWAPGWPDRKAERPIPARAVIPADLSRWHYEPPPGRIALDPETGRIVFPSGQLPGQGVMVYYHYGFSADMGGGEYARAFSEPSGGKIYRVGRYDPQRFPYRLYKGIGEALAAWKQESTEGSSATIEIVDSGVYTEPLAIEVGKGSSLQIRAASRVRPVIRLLDYQADRPDGIGVRGGAGSRVTLEGLLITGRGVQVTGPDPEADGASGDLCRVVIRHCTLVPGWALHHDCEPRRPAEPSLRMAGTSAMLTVEHSILGAIEVRPPQKPHEAASVTVTDSIWDATSDARAALCGPNRSPARVRLTVARSTVIGRVLAHEIVLAENSIFTAAMHVTRIDSGCVRFCYLPPGSRTPRRYECQPDKAAKGLSGEAQAEAVIRVRPQFNSVRYGTPVYCQLSDCCAEAIRRGADDESEMGAFHDLFAPQRAANLRARLDEYTAAGMEAGIIFAS